MACLLQKVKSDECLQHGNDFFAVAEFLEMYLSTDFRTTTFNESTFWHSGVIHSGWTGREGCPEALKALQPADPDRDLVRALQAGNDFALNELIARHKEALFRFIYRYVRNEEDARELLSDTFVRVYCKCRKYEPIALFKTWIYRIAVNLCRDYSRKRGNNEPRRVLRFLSVYGEDVPFLPILDQDSRNPAGALISDEVVAELRHVVNELPHKLKTALILHVLEERPQAECGAILGISVKTVEARVHRARRLLASRLRSHLKESLPFSRWLHDATPRAAIGPAGIHAG